MQIRLEERVRGGWRLRTKTRLKGNNGFVVSWRVPQVAGTRTYRLRLKRGHRVVATSARVKIAVRGRVAPPAPQTPGPAPGPVPATSGLVVAGNHLLDGGKPVQLRGVDRAVFEGSCAWAPAIAVPADGPTDAASVDAMVAWKINAVRVALNPQCWLGVNGLPNGGSAGAYRQAVEDYVALLRRKGLYVILDAHVTAPGTHPSNRIDYMPDADHSPGFWAQLAGAFKTEPGVVFDPINEIALAAWNNPHPSTGEDAAGQWRCWRDGCTLDSVYGGRFEAAGMQRLVDAIRGAGATQPIMLGGLSYTADQTQLEAHLPRDPQNALVADLHAYDFTQDGIAGFDGRAASQYLPTAQKMPLVIGELGERQCDDAGGAAPFTRHVLYDVLDGAQASGTVIGVLGWTWNAGGGWQCPTDPFGEGGPLLIRGYDGTPTTLGTVFRTWFATK